MGNGSCGIAYQLTSGHVVKVTVEHSEHAAARMLLKKNYPCTTKVLATSVLHDPRAEPKTEKWHGQFTFYEIVRQPVRPLDYQEVGVMNFLIADFLNKMEVPDKKDIRNAYDPQHEYIDRVLDRLYPLAKQFLLAMRGNRLVCSDLSASNVGYSAENRIILFDLGTLTKAAKTPRR